MVLSYLGEIGLGFKVNSVEGLPSTTRRTKNEKCGKFVARGGLKPGVIPTPFSQYLTEEQHEVKERDGWDGEVMKTDSPAISYRAFRDLSLPQSMNPNV